MDAANADGDAVHKQYDVALARLEQAFQRVQRAAGCYPSDSLAVFEARQAYERARLVWLSAELTLRGDALLNAPRSRVPRGNVLVVGRSDQIVRSLVVLLKTQGYASMGCSVAELYGALRESAYAVVLLSVDCAMARDRALLDAIRHAVLPLPIVALIRGSLASLQHVPFDHVVSDPSDIGQIAGALDQVTARHVAVVSPFPIAPQGDAGLAVVQP
ncbi:hypothetical protein [Paraburkholderia diazotrophica]|uniref:Uncharacterized protein n=1 Tax=Paraburkholderia diazotrophica TaxID=667676 RepID=A0A1H6XW45_9BURK|nr:hypothetical protein [Paraburkholderia diazotrophica]SEJ33251.1 hypothetical protein SAMN05192539_1009128 [Paraburkholderia diazotrophica]